MLLVYRPEGRGPINRNILIRGVIIGRAQRARTSELNADYVCMYVCMFICHQPTAVSAHGSPRNAQT